MKIFCERLKDLREERGLTATGLAKELGLQTSTIMRWEREERIPSIENLKLISNYFDVYADYRIGNEN